MSDDLFASLTEAKRQKLRDRGWFAVGGLSHGSWHWRRPDGAVVSEEEALRQLERLETEEGEK